MTINGNGVRWWVASCVAIVIVASVAALYTAHSAANAFEDDLIAACLRGNESRRLQADVVDRVNRLEAEVARMNGLPPPTPLAPPQQTDCENAVG